MLSELWFMWGCGLGTGFVLGIWIGPWFSRKFGLNGDLKRRLKAAERGRDEADDLLVAIYDFVEESGAVEGPWLGGAGRRVRVRNRFLHAANQPSGGDAE